ncbi:Cytochrome b [Aliiroseovarius crassostreae]|uniref:Cytochrome B n=1 Tax=Aliiroseovarius crassostreae TaxID=154981 RepID=A0A0N8IBU4_9RHOB|nr:cytochrome b/b6 domain-containing protein [Aliiroseovarius crassostreae]KPN64075.1 cytochrome B [Aliiroseovarius crassostreae]SFU27894.1 Cytochrome b [Aliiroseovarius crassostreae]
MKPVTPDTLPEGIVWRRIWDPALRVFHWLFAGAVLLAWGLGKWGPAVMTVHYYVGYLVIGLLVFRLIWGLVGPAPARFTHFLFGPATTLRYLTRLPKRQPSYWPGHNPLGALSVFALLGLVGLQVASGLFSDPDDYLNVGPLAGLVEFETARWANGWHHRLSTLLAVIVGLHVGAVLFYRIWKREDLVRPMITGKKAVRKDGTPPAQ